MIEDAKGGMDKEKYMSGKSKDHLRFLPFILLRNLAYLQLLCCYVIHIFHELQFDLTQHENIEVRVKVLLICPEHGACSINSFACFISIYCQ